MNMHNPKVKNIDIKRSIVQAFVKLNPVVQLRNPVVFVVYLGTIVISGLYLHGVLSGNTGGEPGWFTLSVGVGLWVTVLFSNFAESIAEDRGHAQAESLKALRKEVNAKRIRNVEARDDYEIVSASSLRMDDLVYIEAGDAIPGDGQVLYGIASVDESAITGESAPVIRESGGDSDAVTGGTRVLSDWIVVRITANSGESFIDRMVSLVEGAKRQKTPNEISIAVFLAALTATFLITIATILPFSIFSVEQNGAGQVVSITSLVALLICLSPTTIGGLLSTISISGMNRLLKANVIVSSGRAVEAAGDINCLLLDKTGTITHGNRQAEEFFTAPGVSLQDMAKSAQLCSFMDQTPEGKSTFALTHTRYKLPEITSIPTDSEIIDFSAETRYSGIKVGNRIVMKGALDCMEKQLQTTGAKIPDDLRRKIDDISRLGGTPLVVIDNGKALGVIYLKDIIKAGIKERLADLRRMGIKSIMITGDNPLTAAAIAVEAGVDDYLAQATPEQKLKLIRKMQAGGELVAMVGDGTNDAPALAQADVAVVMNSGTQAAKEAGNMIDLDSDPTKIIEIVEIGKQLLMTRGSMTTFSLANEFAKYVTLIPATFVSTYPQLDALNVLHLSSPLSAVLSAVIFNALIILGLIPLALRGVTYTPVSAQAMLRHNLLIYGLGGIIVPFVGIKVIDLILTLIGAV